MGKVVVLVLCTVGVIALLAAFVTHVNESQIPEMKGHVIEIRGERWVVESAAYIDDDEAILGLSRKP